MIDTNTPEQNKSIQFNPRNGFRNPGMVSKREMAGDMMKAAAILNQTEVRRATIERFLLAVLNKTGPIDICQEDLNNAAGYMLNRKEAIQFVTPEKPSDPTMFTFLSVVKPNAISDVQQNGQV